MPQKEAKVYIIIVNYNGWQDTIECLESIFNQAYQHYQIVVVDNSPTEYSIEQIKSWLIGENKYKLECNLPNLVYPLSPKPIPFQFLEENEIFDANLLYEQIILIRTKANNGFAHANNVALKLLLSVKSNFYVWLLNNDTVVHPLALRELVAAFDSQKKTGITGSQLREYKDPQKVQLLASRYNEWLGKLKLYKDTRESHYPAGASMMISDTFLKKVGLMEERYFLYFEELDWVKRGKKKGLCVSIRKASKVYHKGSATIGSNSKLADFYWVRSRILFTLKFKPLALLLLYPAFILFAINRIRRKQFDRIPMLFKILLHPKKMHPRE
ncbi:glycosyltransferase family 2 protein [Xanthovirga aplysinae]|uniref:glycosyltransferase family 2 protein n=1 Tax=Xanthovirga aplysinae TaxID=2529853 RepID=UPI0012BC40F4|nr:glycosyltransferase family 2 protein [Xanthovirga aplysinae]MTI33085.1 glycosyltransferase family 2 protein [Xanthovirga aplysinae]